MFSLPIKQSHYVINIMLSHAIFKILHFRKQNFESFTNISLCFQHQERSLAQHQSLNQMPPLVVDVHLFFSLHADVVVLRKDITIKIVGRYLMPLDQ